MNTLISKSKMLSGRLRHRPDAIGITLDRQGWTDVADLIAKTAAAGTPLTHEELFQIVAESDKQRYTLSENRLRIRAAQGHSVAVDLKLPVKAPPSALYHGTVQRFMASICKHGLLPGCRQDVHLSATRETAESVGARRGKPVVLVIETSPMVRDGYHFRCSANGVWLISSVPPQYLRIPEYVPPLTVQTLWAVQLTKLCNGGSCSQLEESNSTMYGSGVRCFG